MKRYAALALLPLVAGCAGQLGGQLGASGLSALTNGGSITPLSNICITLLGQEATDIATLKAQLEATAAQPMTVMVQTPVTVTPKPSSPMVVKPSPVPAPKPVPTVP